MRYNFSHYYNFQAQMQPKMRAIWVQIVWSRATSKLSQASKEPSKAIIYSFDTIFLHFATIWHIFGGQISFILLAIRTALMATFSQLFSFIANPGRESLLMIAMAKYWVSLATLRLKPRIHLMACLRQESSTDSIELLDEFVDSEKEGSEVHFWRSLWEWQLLMFWNFCCIEFLLQFQYRRYSKKSTIEQIQTGDSEILQPYNQPQLSSLRLAKNFWHSFCYLDDDGTAEVFNNQWQKTIRFCSP